MEAEWVAETGFNSSPVTRGATFRARKLALSRDKKMENPGKDLLSKYREFFNSVYEAGTLDRKTKHLIALGASLAAGCEA